MNSNEILNEISLPEDIASLTANIDLPKLPDISLDVSVKEKSDIFKNIKRVSWDKTVEARCDFAYKPSIRHRAGLFFISLWQKSIYGRTLTDIKSDDDMIPFFAEKMAEMITEVLGDCINNGSWAIVTTPMRRHKEHNFASMIAEGIATTLGIPFYFDCAHCHSKHRVNAVFDANNIPAEPNVIIFDDFVTTGSTLKSMQDLMKKYRKTCLFFAGINNKL